MQERIDAVRRMQSYITDHLSEEITLSSLADAAGYSPWHARRLFIEYSGVTPSEYIRRLRLSNSALRLRDEKVTVTDVAFDMGFKSVDGYIRAFAREFGCSPKRYSLLPIPICLFHPYGVNQIPKKEKAMTETRNIFITVIEKPERKVIVKRARTAKEYWTYCNEVGCDVWGILTSIKSISGEPVCLWLPDKYVLPDTGVYVQGVEVDLAYGGIVPEGFDVIKLPASKYLSFQGEPFAEENFGEAIEEVQSAIKKYDPSVIGYAFDRENPRIQLEPVPSRGYIELVAIK